MSPVTHVNHVITHERSRGHSLKLLKPRCRLDIRKFLFVHRVIDIWNSLDESTIAYNPGRCGVAHPLFDPQVLGSIPDTAIFPPDTAIFPIIVR